MQSSAFEVLKKYCSNCPFRFETCEVAKVTDSDQYELWYVYLKFSISDHKRVFQRNNDSSFEEKSGMAHSSYKRRAYTMSPKDAVQNEWISLGQGQEKPGVNETSI